MKKEVSDMMLIGQVYTPSQQDGNGSFTTVWQEALNGKIDFDQLNQASLINNQTALVVLSPYSFLYWVGVLVPTGTEVPVGYHSFELPASEVAEIDKKATSPAFQMPVSISLQQALTQLDQEVELPNHLGHTYKPYYLQIYQPEKMIERVYLSEIDELLDEDEQ